MAGRTLVSTSTKVLSTDITYVKPNAMNKINGFKTNIFGGDDITIETQRYSILKSPTNKTEDSSSNNSTSTIINDVLKIVSQLLENINYEK